MTHNPSRKRFFAHLLGAAAAASALPAATAQAASPAGAPKAAAQGKGKITIRHDARAVSRRETA